MLLNDIGATPHGHPKIDNEIASRVARQTA
jgi:hypothetical protein